MSGCFENYEQNSKLTNRYELLKKAVAGINADFVGLVDTFKWNETFSIEQLKRDFGYKNVFTVDMDDTRVEKNIGITVMTNLAVKKFNIVRAFNRNYIETTLDDLNVYTCYLDDISEDTRLSQVKSLLEQIKRPAIVHGDLNTFSKKDLSTFDDLAKTFEVNNIALVKKLRPIIEDMRRCEVEKLLKLAGFIDSAEEWIPTMPTKLFPAVQIGDPFIRVDYIFHTKDIVVKDLTVTKGGLSDKVSDHFPLSASISY